jgi:hypothetical protein
MSKPNEILFSATRKDFRVDHFSTGGPGGQNHESKEERSANHSHRNGTQCRVPYV